jgi:hypothetical protein
MPIIPAFQRLRQGDGEFKASLGYIVRSVSRKKKFFLFNAFLLTAKEGIV